MGGGGQPGMVTSTGSRFDSGPDTGITALEHAAREAHSPAATTSFGWGVASYARRTASFMLSVSGPVISSMSAWRGLATNRIPRPSML